MSIASVSGPAGAPQPPVDGDHWQAERGDTLSGIARVLQQQGMAGTVAGLVRELARLNGLANPDRIEVGQVLNLPPRAVRSAGEASTDAVETVPPAAPSAPAPLRAEERRALLEGALFRLGAAREGSSGSASTRSPPRSPDGTPLFRQGDPAWRAERLGADAEGPTLARAGCAVTACAMALSRVTGQVLTPDALVRHLRQRGGFQGALVDWSHAGTLVDGGPRAAPAAFDRSSVDRELDAGRPVLLRVVHEIQGVPRQHWVCLTGRDAGARTYSANDPATGRTTTLIPADEGLVSVAGEPVRYASDGRVVSFALPPSGAG